MKPILKKYKIGCGYKYGDELVPRAGCSPEMYDCVTEPVIVLYQDTLAPHQYTVLSERKNPRTPAHRFVKFTINGHEWIKP